MDSTLPRGGCARLCCFLSLVMVLAACQPVREQAPQPDFDQLMEQAAALADAGRHEAALAALNEAAKADPTSKAPWMRTTQIQFQAANYGAAVVSAQEVLQRDADDHVADSYLVVSSLRIAIDTLSRMRGADALTGAARVEAEKLAASMRETLGQEILVPQAAQAAAPAPRARRAAPARAQPTPAESDPGPASRGEPTDPFSVLQGGD